MPLCAVIVITSQQDTEKSECGPRESWDSESPSPMRNGEIPNVSDGCQIDAEICTVP